jgi:hypothetical protein
MNIEQKYIERKLYPSDINEHLETLFTYAKQCDVIAEFGVRDVVSSYALAHARPKKLICVDINKNNNINIFMEECKNENINARFDLANTLEYILEDVDMLFIDTLHTFKQLSKELELHHSKVKKYLIFHDTISFGNNNEDGTTDGICGLIPAISNFLKQNLNWKEDKTYINNNGLTILKNIINVN